MTKRERKVVVILLVLVVVTAAIIVARLKTDPVEETVMDQPTAERNNQRSRNVHELVDKRRERLSGLPDDLALSRATTTEQREFLLKKLQLSAMSPAQTMAGAKAKLHKIEETLQTTSDPAEKERLERQSRLIKKIIENLEAME